MFHRRRVKAFAIALAWAVSAGAVAQTQNLQPGTMQARLVACTQCHGAEGRAGPDGYYPRIAGKPATYLFNQLVAFRDGERSYRPMTHLLTFLSDDYLQEMATWFADQHPPYPDPVPARQNPDALERARVLIFEGDSAREIPACASCHGSDLAGRLPAIPGLLGLPHDYIGSQFGAWANGLRRSLAPDCMATLAKRLTPEEVSAVAAWLSSQRVPNDYRPAVSSAALPMACGSHPER